MPVQMCYTHRVKATYYTPPCKQIAHSVGNHTCMTVQQILEVKQDEWVEPARSTQLQYKVYQYVMNYIYL